MQRQFVHLHLHTDCSFLEGACPVTRPGRADSAERRRYGDLVTLALEHNSPAVAMTDSNSMGGAVEFYEALRAVNVKPIIGCEIQVAPPNGRGDGPGDPPVSGYPLVLLTRNAEGYGNLCRIVSRAHLHGGTGEPCISRDFLAGHCGGLIALSGCLRGELAVSVLNGGREAAEKTLREYLDLFGKENFFLEVMYHGLEAEKTVNRCIAELSRRFGLPMVATNDVRYLRRDHALAAELLACLRRRTTLEDPDRMRLPPEYYYKSFEEMSALFGAEMPEALSNTLMVAEQCGFRFDFSRKLFPVFPVPEGKTAAELLRETCFRSVPDRYGFELENPPPDRKSMAEEIRTRLDRELETIDRIDDSGSFLLLRELVCRMRKQGISVGPGRGAEAGSMVAYLTGITGVDPIRFRLLSEQFLNPERSWRPVFIFDFGDRSRDSVFKEIIRQFGPGHAAWVESCEIRKVKSSLRDAARVLGISSPECSRIERLVMDGFSTSLSGTCRENPKLQELFRKDPRAEKLIHAACLIRGLKSSCDVTDTVIAGDRTLDSILPLTRGPDGEAVTQYGKYSCDYFGFLEMTFSEQPVLTLISDTLKQIRSNRRIELDPEHIPPDDPKTFALLSRGDTSGVFQLEAGGLQSLCRQLGVESMEHIIALIAVYHPGPMEFIPSFIARKHGEEKIEYDHPKLEPILGETYGLLIYQEQVLEVFHALAGFSYGCADLARRAIGKRKISEMERYHKEFLQGCAETSDIPAEDAEKLWEKLCRFAICAFNKAHSAAYALLAYRTAYLKANYPQEFFAALLCREEKNSGDFSSLPDECRKQGIALLPPDVNAGDLSFAAEGEAIRFGLCAVRGLKKNVCRVILDSRRKDGAFVTPVEFLERTGGCVNEKALELLIRAGALDSMGVFRSRLFAAGKEAIACAAERRRNRESGQGTLFDSVCGSHGLSDPVYPDIPEWEEDRRRADEKQLLGFDFSENPVVREGAPSDGTLPPSVAEPRRESLEENRSQVSSPGDQSLRMEVRIAEKQCNARLFEELKAILRNHSGGVPVLFFVTMEKGTIAEIEISREFFAAPSGELTACLEALLGEGCCRISGAFEASEPEKASVSSSSMTAGKE